MKPGMYSVLFVLIALALPNRASAEKIVMIGDSLTCEYFGEAIFKQLNTGGNQVVQYCMHGSAPSHWLNGRKVGAGCKTRSTENPSLVACPTVAPRLEAIVAANPGARFIAALGTNSLVPTLADGCAAGQSAANVRASYSKFAKTLGQAKCDWILPPNMQPEKSRGWKPCHVTRMQKNLADISNQIRASVADPKNGTYCRVIESGEVTSAGSTAHETADGIHRTRPAGYAWAAEIKDEILANSDRRAKPNRNRSGSSSAAQ